MANEIRAHLNSTFAGSVDIVARLTNPAGTQVGADIAMAQGAVSSLFVGTVPGATAAGEYDVRIIDTGDSDALLGVGTLFWDGSAEVDELTFRANLTAARAASLDNLDTAVSTRSSHAAPDLSNLDVAVSTRLATAGYTVPDNAGIAANAAALSDIQGVGFSSATDSLEAIRDQGDVAWTTGGGGGGLTQQEVRDAMKLAPTAGAPATGSVDAALDEIEADTAAIEPRVDVAISTRSSHAAPDLSNLDVAVSSRSSHGAPDLSNLDVAVSSRSSHAAPDLSNLDVAVSSRLATAGYTAPDNAGIAANGTAIGSLNDLSAADVAGELSTYDAPTKAELDTAEANILAAVGSGGLTAQEVRDAMKLAPSAGAPAAGSVDTHLDEIEADTAAVQPLVDVAVSTRSSHAAPDLSNLDVAVSSRSSHAAPDLSNLDAAVSSRLSAAGYTAPDNATIAANATALSNIQGGGFNSATDSLEAIRDQGDAAGVTGGGGGITPQEVRDAMKLAPSAGAPAAGSIDTALDEIEGDTAAMQPLLDVAVSTRSSHAAPDLTNLDAPVSSRLATAGYTAPDNASIASNGAAISSLNDLDSSAVQAAAEAAITAQEPIDANVTQVAGSGVVGIADFRADVSALETEAAAAARAAADQAAHTATQSAVSALPAPADVVAARASVVTAGDALAPLQIVAWLERNGQRDLAVVSASAQFFEPDGTALTAAIALTLDAARGVFRGQSAGVTLASNTNYYVEISIVDGSGTTVSHRATPTLS